MKAYKGFDKDLKCRGFQFEAGKEYREEKADICKSGFHACENPLDVFKYYPPATSRYCKVDLDANEQKEDDSKRVGKKILILDEISLQDMINAGIAYIEAGVNWEDSASTNTGYRSASTNTGDSSVSINTGDYSASTNTGDHSAAVVEGEESVAAAIGYKSKAKGSLGSFLVLADWIETDGGRHIVDVKSVKVDGEKIKPGVFYTMKDGEIIEADASS